MSIAVSSVVRPSRLLLTMMGAMSLLCFAIGIMIASGLTGELSPAVRFPIAAFTIFLAFFGFYHGAGYGKPIHIDISGTGQLRLTAMRADRACTEINWPHVDGSGEVVRMMNNSTLWPRLLLLRLQSGSGKIIIVPILPDSVSRDSFLALSVACRWIAAQNNSSERGVL